MLYLCSYLVDSATTVIICGWTAEAEDAKQEEVSALQTLAKDFGVPFVQVHIGNTGLLWKTVIKNRVLQRLMPLDEVTKKHQKQLDKIQPFDRQDDNVYVKKEKKKKCNVQ